MEIVVSPIGQFRVEGQDSEIGQVAAAFATSRAHGLAQLIKYPSLRSRSPSASFWHDYASTFMRSFCSFSDTDPLQVPIDEQAVASHLQKLPPIAGAEYVSEDLLAGLWSELENQLKRASAEFASPRQFIAKEYPAWADIGKIHFHLAENRTGEGEAFAFLSTYTVRIPGKARVQHRPLGIALKESVGHGDHKHLEQLLGPIHKASKNSSFLREILGNRSIYALLYLDPKEAFRFVADIPHCEAAGIVCKVPQWWHKGRPPQAKVAVTIGSKRKQSQVGFDQLLDFNVEVSVGGEGLTKEQLKEILEADGPLVELGGRWIEVNKEQIEKMLQAWDKAVEAAYSEGISFATAMRMMTGFSRGQQLLGVDNANEVDDGWLDVVAGPAFDQLIKDLRSPEHSVKDTAGILEKHLKGKLRPYQQTGLAWLHSVTKLHLGGCLADDMGLGKTVQILAMLLVLKYQHKAKRPSLLVVPASLLGNWLAEIKKFAPSLRYEVIHGSMLAARDIGNVTEARVKDVDLVITTYGMVLRTDWLRSTQWQVVVADEAQAIKNARTKQSYAMRSLKSATKIAMTGTPVENRLGDLWSIFDFACPGLLGSETQFKNAVKQMNETDKEGAVNFAPLRQLIAPYILRRKKTDKSVISDLPEKIEMVGTCFLTHKQATLYQKEVSRLAKSLTEADGIQRKGLVLSSLMKFKQICNHPSQYAGNDSYVPTLSGKFLKLKELVETIAARQEKLLVFTQFRELTDILAHYLGECFGCDGLVIHGGTAIAKRQHLVDQFQSPSGPPFFVLSLKAGGTGLNLTAASHVIHFDRWWNPAVEDQATDRAFRIGQKKNVLVHKLVCKGTIEEKIDAMIAEKKQLAEALIEGGKEMNLTELSDEDLINLVRLDIQHVEGES